MRIVPIIEFVDVDALPPPGSDRGGAYAEMLAALASERIVIVFCSRRTRAEVESMRQALGVFHPFVCEDGAALFVPERYFGDTIENARRVGGYEAIEFAASYESVGATLHRVADRLNIGVLGFGDMSVELVSRECGLSLLDARLAKLREYSERFRLLCENPVAERRLFRALEAAGLTCRKGDRFHDAGSAAGAGRAISWLTARYTAAFGHVLTVLQGEAAQADACIPVGECWIDGLPPGLPRGSPVQVRCAVAANGLIDVMALDMTSGRMARAEIHRSSGLADDEVAREAAWVKGLRIQ